MSSSFYIYCLFYFSFSFPSNFKPSNYKYYFNYSISNPTSRTGVVEEYRYNLVLFKEIKRFWQYREQLGWYAMFTNLFGNVIIFMPFGFFLPMASKYRSFFAAVFYSFTLSLCVETFQLLTKVGSFDVDDLLLNTIGGVAGYIIFVICAAVRRRHVRLSTRKRR